jgi:TonB family protein
VAQRRIEAEHVSAVRSVAAATTSPVAVAPVAPALRGPLEVQAPVGPSVGPRAVAGGGDSMGLAAPGALGTGSSVREGVASDRDVAGSASGPRLASVNTRVGDSLWGAGPGGSGDGLGVSFEDCTARAEVQTYMEQVRQRMISRWVIPPDVPSNQSVTLQFKLDAAGSATQVRLVRSDDERLGVSAVDALRSASPFPPMSERVRCLARDRLVATFMNPLAGSS